MAVDWTRYRSPLRAAAFAVGIAGTAFWLYTFYAIAQVPPGDHTGFQWLAIMPLGFVFIAFIVPTFIVALTARGIGQVFGLALGLAGLAAFALLWAELLREFYH